MDLSLPRSQGLTSNVFAYSRDVAIYLIVN